MRYLLEKTAASLTGGALAVMVLISLSAHSHDERPLEEQTSRWATAFFESFNQHMNPGSLDRWMENWADNAERRTPMGNAKGRVEIRRLYESLQVRYRDMHMEIVGLIVQGNRASVELETRGIHRETGREVAMPNVALLKFNPAGEVVSAHVYLDMENIARQIKHSVVLD